MLYCRLPWSLSAALLPVPHAAGEGETSTFGSGVENKHYYRYDKILI